MGRSATNFIRKLNESTFGMCSMTQCNEKNRSGPGGTWVLSVKQEKILAGAQVQTSLFLQDSVARCDGIVQGIIIKKLCISRYSP